MKNKKSLFTASVFIFFFLILILVNTYKNKNSLTGPQSTLSISIIDPPAITSVNNPTRVSWMIDTNASFKAKSITLFYGQQSTPSALLKTDSPKAVGYTNFTTDFLKDEFFIPYTFETILIFDAPQTIYYRAYAKVNGENIWTPEYQLLVK
jgi:hypothetical protein